MEEVKVCKTCGKELPISQFQKTRSGNHVASCKSCHNKAISEGRKRKRLKMGGGKRYEDPEFDGKTPREVQDILARAAKWLNNYGGFTCEVTLLYEKKINLDIH